MLDPGALERLHDLPAELVGDRHEPSGPPVIDVVVHQALFGASGAEEGLPGLSFTDGRHA